MLMPCSRASLANSTSSPVEGPQATQECGSRDESFISRIYLGRSKSFLSSIKPDLSIMPFIRNLSRCIVRTSTRGVSMPSVDYAAGTLGDRSIETAEADPAVIYALDADLRMTYCNPAWDALARANNGGHLVRPHQIGFTLMYAIPGCLREFYRQAFQSVGD